MKWIMIISLSFLLTGCLTTNELLNTAATTATAATSVVLGVPIVPTVALTATAGIATGIVTKEPTQVDVSSIENEHQAEVVQHQQTVSFWKSVAMYIIGGGILLTVIAWIIPGPQIFRRK